MSLVYLSLVDIVDSLRAGRLGVRIPSVSRTLENIRNTSETLSASYSPDIRFKVARTWSWPFTPV